MLIYLGTESCQPCHPSISLMTLALAINQGLSRFSPNRIQGDNPGRHLRRTSNNGTYISYFRLRGGPTLGLFLAIRGYLSKIPSSVPVRVFPSHCLKAVFSPRCSYRHECFGNCIYSEVPIGASRILSILRQSRRIYRCWPLKGMRAKRNQR